jgi:hypothetical protein
MVDNRDGVKVSARAVAALARKSAALLHEDFSLAVGEDGAEPMVARISRRRRRGSAASRHKGEGRRSREAPAFSAPRFFIVENDFTTIGPASRTVPIASSPAR